MGKKCIVYRPFSSECAVEVDDGNPVGQAVGGISDVIGGAARGIQNVGSVDRTSGTSFAVNIGSFKWDPLKDIQNLISNPGQEVSRIWDVNVGNPLKDLLNNLLPDLGKDSDIPKTPTEDSQTYTDRIKQLQGIAQTVRGIQERQLAFPGAYQLNTASNIAPILNYGMELISTDQVNKNVETELAASIEREKVRDAESADLARRKLEEAAQKQVSDYYMKQNKGAGTGIGINTLKAGASVVGQVGKK